MKWLLSSLCLILTATPITAALTKAEVAAKAFRETGSVDINDVRSRFVLGNPAAPTEFQAHVKMKFWGEDTITIFEPNVKSDPVFKDDKIELDLPNRKIQWYQGNGSSLKWLFIFKSKPTSNTYTLQLGDAWDDFNWNYQRPLSDVGSPTEEFIGHDGETWVRPANWEEATVYSQRRLHVEGSYAVYHKTKRNHRAGGTNYRTGKALHIYRPKATDSLGKYAWADLHIEHGVYAVTIPQKFLDEATYPVTVNDELGWHEIGDTEYIDGAGGAVAGSLASANTGWTIGTDASITQAFAYVRAAGDVTFGIQAIAGGRPDVTLADTSNFSTVAAAWLGGNLDAPYAYTASTEISISGQCGDSIAYTYDDVGTGEIKIDTGLAYTTGEVADYLATATTLTTVNASFYIDYTPAGAAAEGQVITVNPF